MLTFLFFKVNMMSLTLQMGADIAITIPQQVDIEVEID
jgi:hypothetical protein